MPNLEELIKIREQEIESYWDENKIECFLQKNAQEYYNRFINTSLTFQASEDLKNDRISAKRFGKFVTTSNSDISKLFFAKIASLNIRHFSASDIDYISTKDDPVIYIEHYYDSSQYVYFTRPSYIGNLARNDQFDFSVEEAKTLDAYGNLFITFEVSAQVPKLVFSGAKVLVKQR